MVIVGLTLLVNMLQILGTQTRVLRQNLQLFTTLKFTIDFRIISKTKHIMIQILPATTEKIKFCLLNKTVSCPFRLKH